MNFVRTEEEFRQLPIYSKDRRQFLGFDTEANKEGKLLSFQIAWSPKDAVTVFIKDMDSKFIQEFLDRHYLIMHYGFYDVSQMHQIGVRLTPTFDTYVAARLIYYKERSGFGLKELAKKHLGMEMKTIQEIAGEDVDMESADLEEYVAYANDDAIAALRLFNFFCNQDDFSEFRYLIYFESGLQGALARMYLRGMLVQPEKLHAIKESLWEKMQIIQQEIPASLGSSQSLSGYLFKTLKLNPDGVRMNKTGFYSVARGYLERIRPQAPELIDKILDWKSMAKIVSTYTDSYGRLADKNNIIHPKFDSFGAITGRVSSSGPNFQNVPNGGYAREVRKAFLARPGYLLVAIDYKQIEFIVMAILAKEYVILDALAGGFDIHALTASKMYRVPIEAVSKKQRSSAKAINYGMIFGGGAGMFLPYVDGDTDEDKWHNAHAMYNSYMDSYPALAQYLKDCGKAVFKGYTTTAYGRRRWIGKYNKNMSGRQKAGLFRLAQNSPVQGTAADIIKIAMFEVDKILPYLDGKVHMLLQIHDELVFEIAEDADFDYHVRMMAETMESAYSYMKVDIEVGANWFDMYPYNIVTEPA